MTAPIYATQLRNEIFDDLAEYATQPDAAMSFVEVTATTHTLLLTDAYKVLLMNNAGAITLTVPPATSVVFDEGVFIEVHQEGAGVITFAPGAGVTIESRDDALSTVDQFSVCALRKKPGVDVWALVGDIV